MMKNWGVGLDETGLKYLQNNYDLYNKLYNGWMNTNTNSLSEDFAEYMGRKSKVLYPHIVDANSIKNAGTLGKPASSIMKGGVRGAAHLIPIVGAGLTAADIYQGLNQPVAAGTLDWNQMTPKQQQQRIQGYQQVQNIIDNIQARQRVEDQYRQQQADMIRRARFGI
jgi:hypothetical protein